MLELTLAMDMQRGFRLFEKSLDMTIVEQKLTTTVDGTTVPAHFGLKRTTERFQPNVGSRFSDCLFIKVSRGD